MKTGKLLKFLGVGDLTVYNTTPPLWLSINGVKKRVILGRVEAEKEYAHSRICLFGKYKKGLNSYELLDNFVFWGEDPSITTVWAEGREEIILGIVEVSAHIRRLDGNYEWIFKTVLYRGTDLAEMKRWREVPGKDNRLVQKKSGQKKTGPIAFCNRPQGKNGGLGTIGFKMFESLEHICEESLRDAVLLEGMFPKGWWGGANELHDLPRNRIGIMGHAAHEEFPWCEISKFDHGLFDTGNWSKEYKTIYTDLNCSTMQFSPPVVIASRKDFPVCPAKFPQLNNVEFTSGISFENNVPMLYAGLGDWGEGVIPVTHPAVVDMYK